MSGTSPGDGPGTQRLIRAAAAREDVGMFGFKKKDPVAKLRKEYEACMKSAIELQRAGDIRGFAAKSEEAAELERRLAAEEQGSTP